MVQTFVANRVRVFFDTSSLSQDEACQVRQNRDAFIPLICQEAKDILMMEKRLQENAMRWIGLEWRGMKWIGLECRFTMFGDIETMNTHWKRYWRKRKA